MALDHQCTGGAETLAPAFAIAAFCIFAISLAISLFGLLMLALA